MNLLRGVWSPKPRKADIERHLAQKGMGILVALRESGMTIEQAQKDLFNTDVYRAARRLRLNPALIEFLEWGMELEDVAALAPRGLRESYQKMGALLRRLLAKHSRKASGRRPTPSRVRSLT